jgi:hypothetical protein
MTLVAMTTLKSGEHRENSAKSVRTSDPRTKETLHHSVLGHESIIVYFEEMFQLLPVCGE